MCLLVNKIILSFIDSKNQVSPTEIYRKHKIVDKQRIVEVENVPIRIKLNEDNYLNIITKLQYGEKKYFVEERNAIQWIEDAVVGPITKEMLEEERVKEG